MITGNGTAVPIERTGSPLRAPGRWDGWRQLDPEDRLALIESALKIPANDFADDLPLAL